jgi:hypothetical protein
MNDDQIPFLDDDQTGHLTSDILYRDEHGNLVPFPPGRSLFGDDPMPKKSFIRPATRKILRSDDDSPPESVAVKAKREVHVTARSRDDLVEGEDDLYDALMPRFRKMAQQPYDAEVFDQQVRAAFTESAPSVVQKRTKEALNSGLWDTLAFPGVDQEDFESLIDAWFLEYGLERYLDDLLGLLLPVNEAKRTRYDTREEQNDSIFSENRVFGIVITEGTALKSVANVAIAMLWNYFIEQVMEKSNVR